MQNILMREFMAVVALTQRNNKRWRYGQVLFNSLVEVYPIWAEEIRGTALDPYFHELSSVRITDCMLWLDNKMRLEEYREEYAELASEEADEEDRQDLLHMWS